MKVCRDCGKELPLSDFYIDANRKDGHYARCKKCHMAKCAEAKKKRPEYYREKERERYHADIEKARATKLRKYYANHDREIERMKAWKAAHKDQLRERRVQYDAENSDRIKAYSREYNSRPEVIAQRKDYDSTPERRSAAREHSRRYRDRNPERVKATTREWYRDNYEHVLLYNHAQRAKRRSVDVGDITQETWIDRVEYFGDRCAYCLAAPTVTHIEHMTPISRGGPHALENVVPACPSCNFRKGTKTLLEFLPSIPDYAEIAAGNCSSEAA